VEAEEMPKERSDRQLTEVLTELRVVLPGAQVLLGFLLTVPFATRFGKVTKPERALFFACLLLSAGGTVLLMAPSVYHRVRWGQGGKTDVVLVAHRLFLSGSALLGAAIIAAIMLVADVLFGVLAAVASACALTVMLVGSWYLLPIERTRSPRVRRQE
jgi:hypothetical protein